MHQCNNIFRIQTVPPCPCGWQKISNGCYLFVKNKVTCDVARANCTQSGGDLVVPRSALQCDLLSSHAASFGVQVPWIGVFRYVNRSLLESAKCTPVGVHGEQ